MTRATPPTLAALAALAALTGTSSCRSKTDAPNTGSPDPNSHAVGSGSGAGGSVSAPRGSNDATAALVRDAFGGHVPAFPLLANDGSTVAVGVASPVGRSDVSTYRVALFTGWTASTDGWSTGPQDYPIVDPTMAAMLLEGAGDEAAPVPDRATLQTRGAAVTKLLTDGKYAPFDGPVLTIGPAETTVGSARLRITHDHDAALTVHLQGAGGTELASNTIPPRAMGHVADLTCVSMPVARRAWLDARRKRVLVEVGWNAGPEMCGTPDLEYGVWPVP
jgi:hypothetical protein